MLEGLGGEGSADWLRLEAAQKVSPAVRGSCINQDQWMTGRDSTFSGVCYCVGAENTVILPLIVRKRKDKKKGRQKVKQYNQRRPPTELWNRLSCLQLSTRQE